MDRSTALQIMASPEFQALTRERRRIVVPMLALIIVAYFGFILLVAFAPSVLGEPVFGGPASLGIYAGIGLLLLSFAITGVYIRLSKGRVQELLAQIRAKAN